MTRLTQFFKGDDEKFSASQLCVILVTFIEAMSHPLATIIIPIQLMAIQQSGFMPGFENTVIGIGMCVANAASWLTDRIGHIYIPRFGEVFNIIFIIIYEILIGLFLIEHRYTSLVGVLMLGPVVKALIKGPINTSFKAIEADAVSKKQMEKWKPAMRIWYIFAMSMGGLFEMCIITWLGNEWTLDQVVPIIMLSIACSVPKSLVSFFMSMKKNVQNDDSEQQLDTVPMLEKNASSADVVKNTMGTESGTKTGSFKGTVHDSTETSSPSKDADRQLRRRLPVFMFVYQSIFMLGSGMSIRFFPLFFYVDMGMSPLLLQMMALVLLLGIFLMTHFVKNYTSMERFKNQDMFTRISLMNGVGIICTLLMLSVVTYVHLPFTWAIVALCMITRSTFFNATHPMETAIITNNVPKNERTRWDSLESVPFLVWSFSAIIGGLISDMTHSYKRTFLFTTTIHMVAVAFFMVSMRKMLLKK